MASHSLFSLHLPKPHLLRASSATTVQSPPQSLEKRFGRKGIKFSDSGDVPTVELSVRNRSSLRLQIADGIVTSYRPKVYWKDDGFEEVLYTIGDGDSSVKGGLGLVLNCVSRDGSAWSALKWSVKDADSDSIDAVQVELSCANIVDGSLDISYVVSLYPLSMATVKLTSGCSDTSDLKAKKVLQSRDSEAAPIVHIHHLIQVLVFYLHTMRWNVSTEIYEPEAWKVEDNLYTILKQKLSRVYAAPPSERMKRIYNTSPSKYQTIDQGSGLGFRVHRQPWFFLPEIWKGLLHLHRLSLHASS